MIPARIVLLDRLPVTDNGKVDRRALLAAATPEPPREVTPPGDPLEARLVEIWEQILDHRPLGVTDDFIALGGNSLQGAELLTAIEELYEHDLPPSILIEAPTIRQLATVLREKTFRTAALVPMQPRGGRTPFFLVHSHSGQVGTFRDLARALDPDQPFYALQSVGRWAGRAPHTTIREMAEHYLAEISAVQPSGPYLLGGHCYGSLVALEMAHLLAERGEQVALLFMMYCTPEDFPGLAPPRARFRFRLRGLPRRVLPATLLERIDQHREAMAGRGLWGRLGYLGQVSGRILTRTAAGRAASAPRAVSDDRRDVATANLLAQKRHRPRGWPGRVTLLLHGELERHYSPDPSKDWGHLATRYDIRFMPLRHGHVFLSPRVQPLADLLDSVIREATT